VGHRQWPQSIQPIESQRLLQSIPTKVVSDLTMDAERGLTNLADLSTAMQAIVPEVPGKASENERMRTTLREGVSNSTIVSTDAYS
jgi:hypothetical protein